jgi:hypothetical protein
MSGRYVLSYNNEKILKTYLPITIAKETRVISPPGQGSNPPQSTLILPKSALFHLYFILLLRKNCLAALTKKGLINYVENSIIFLNPNVIYN